MPELDVTIDLALAQACQQALSDQIRRIKSDPNPFTREVGTATRVPRLQARLDELTAAIDTTLIGGTL